MKHRVLFNTTKQTCFHDDIERAINATIFSYTVVICDQGEFSSYRTCLIHKLLKYETQYPAQNFKIHFPKIFRYKNYPSNSEISWRNHYSTKCLTTSHSKIKRQLPWRSPDNIWLFGFLPGAFSTSSRVVERLEFPECLQRVWLRDRNTFFCDLRYLHSFNIFLLLLFQT